jgi:hypothetical protein
MVTGSCIARDSGQAIGIADGEAWASHGMECKRREGGRHRPKQRRILGDGAAPAVVQTANRGCSAFSVDLDINGVWKWNPNYHLLKYKYGYRYLYSNSNVVIKWIHPNSFLSIFSIWFHLYSAISCTIRIRLYKTVSYLITNGKLCSIEF